MSVKLNLILGVGDELAYNDVAVLHVSLYATGTPPNIFQLEYPAD